MQAWRHLDGWSRWKRLLLTRRQLLSLLRLRLRGLLTSLRLMSLLPSPLLTKREAAEIEIQIEIGAPPLRLALVLRVLVLVLVLHLVLLLVVLLVALVALVALVTVALALALALARRTSTPPPLGFTPQQQQRLHAAALLDREGEQRHLVRGRPGVRARG